MRVPLSWVKDFVEIDMPVEKLAHELTMAGLEVEEIHYVGLPMPGGASDLHASNQQADTKVSGLEWDPEKIVVAAILEVMPHPNADRLVLCRLDDGQREHIVLTGAPDLFEYKGQGLLQQPLKVAYAKEGAQIYDGHQPGYVLTTLKRAKIRGVESYSMVCSEKELGISDEHEGIMILDADAPTGMPLVDYMGDAVLEIAITPNIARDANMVGVAREIAAITKRPLKLPDYEMQAEGPSIEGRANLEIKEPVLNPRFVLGLVENVQIGPSPAWVQRRLRLAGMRPINNIVDATNYAMLELGEPLHAFDYDILVERAGGQAPTIITRRAEPGEKLTTLDGVERTPKEFTVLVTDTAGSLSIAGVMGGLESEVHEHTRNVLLEGAAWNFINIRRTLNDLHIPSEASYRFSRGVHPSLAETGVRLGLSLMRRWAGGVVAEGLVDSYPLPPQPAVVEITTAEIERWLGAAIPLSEATDILRRLEFTVELTGSDALRATSPDHRLDIGEGIVGVADLMEEIARVYGYERIPETRLSDELPHQKDLPNLEREERLRDILVDMGMQEVITYRMTSPEREARLLPPAEPADDRPYVRMANPIASDRSVLRHSLLHSILEAVERNARIRPRLALFEIGPVFLASEESDLPDEVQKFALAISGPRAHPAWQGADTAAMDFYDLKGILESVFENLRISGVRYEPGQHPSFHPGKCAFLVMGERRLGVMGELHPLIHERYDFPETPVLAAELDLQPLIDEIPDRYPVEGVPAFPPVLEDLAVVVDGNIPAGQVEGVIRQAGGEAVKAIHLFDVYRSEQIGKDKKSLAYNLTYQNPERTLTDQDVARIRQRIIRRLEEELNAKLRT